MPVKVSVREFESFIITSSAAQTADELFSLLIASLEKHGFDKAVFSIITDKDLPPEGYSLGVFHNFSDDWIKHYVEKRLDLIDPIKKYIEIASQPYKWDDLHQNMHISNDQTQFLNGVTEAGFLNGVTIPLRGSRSQLSCLALASSEKIDACDPRLDLINAYCQQFFLCYKRFFPPNHNEEDCYKKILSPKEILILTWVANGKTDEEIATITNISRHTVDTHMRHIFQKLDATNRIQAVVKGLMQGIIHP